MATVFSGIQPTGHLTIGNYLGAIKNWVKMQHEHDCIFCIVDLHAITVPQDPKELREACITNMAAYIAAGIDPKKSIIFTQSAVSNHSELAWILGCSTPVGWLNRMTQFKDKAGKDQEKGSLGLYAYPVLMAGDILLYDATHVPVGEDQTQHLELARDVAGAFNRQYKTEYFKEPQGIFNKQTTRIMSLRDGTSKMSKSDESDYSRINLEDDADYIMKKVKKAKSDAIEGIYFDEENRPEVSNLLNIYCAFAEVDMKSAESRFKGSGTGQFKEELGQVIIEKLSPVRNALLDLKKDPSYIHSVAEEGAARANEIAEKRMQEIREIVGLSC